MWEQGIVVGDAPSSVSRFVMIQGVMDALRYYRKFLLFSRPFTIRPGLNTALRFAGTRTFC